MPILIEAGIGLAALIGGSIAIAEIGSGVKKATTTVADWLPWIAIAALAAYLLLRK